MISIKNWRVISLKNLTKLTYQSPHQPDMKRNRNGNIKEENLAVVLNTRVAAFRPLIPPGIIQEELPVNDESRKNIIRAREEVSDIVCLKSKKVLCIVGPCSIHDERAALEYAAKLRVIANKPHIKENVFVVMRVYFEKPRTTVGWKGLINDPHLDGSFQINKGLRQARKILLSINEIGLPCAIEFLDAISPQFTSDLVSWGAIGARTTESQIHRELASGLSCPIGFKNGTSGSVKLAVDSVKSSANPHHFMGVNDQGIAAIVKTKGNTDTHIVLRGGVSGTNYSPEDVANATHLLKQHIGEDHNGIVVDCSHGNSEKKCTNQIKVVQKVAEQISKGDTTLCGVMIESNLVSGNQKLVVGVTKPEDLIYGKSITDECVDLETTEKMLNILSKGVLERNNIKA